MKMKLRLTSVMLLTLVCFVSCRSHDGTLAIIAPSQVDEGGFATLSTDVESTSDNSGIVSYEWTASAGTILGEGSSVILAAPSEEGATAPVIFVSVSATNQQGEQFQGTAYLQIASQPPISRQIIIIKADDYTFGTYDGIPPKWQVFIDYINSMHINASIGVIAKHMLEGHDNEFAQIRETIANGNIEFWCHGYDHSEDLNPDGTHKDYEFEGTPLAQQTEHLAACEGLAEKNLGTVFQTFGAPYNRTDENTVLAINSISDFKVWLNGDDRADKFVIKKVFAIESDVCKFCVNYAAFLEQYNEYAAQEYLLLEVHPAAWGDNDWQEFKKIIEFLVGQNVIFLTPFEYYQLVTPLPVTIR